MKDCCRWNDDGWEVCVCVCVLMSSFCSVYRSVCSSQREGITAISQPLVTHTLSTVTVCVCVRERDLDGVMDKRKSKAGAGWVWAERDEKGRIKQSEGRRDENMSNRSHPNEMKWSVAEHRMFALLSLRVSLPRRLSLRRLPSDTEGLQWVDGYIDGGWIERVGGWIDGEVGQGRMWIERWSDPWIVQYGWMSQVSPISWRL